MRFLKSFSVMAVLSLTFVMVSGAEVEARSPAGTSPSKTVTGEVSKVEGEFHMAKDLQGKDTLEIVDKSYVITDQAGNELRLELNDDTTVRNRVNPGDRIEAKISPEGQTLSVMRLK